MIYFVGIQNNVTDRENARCESEEKRRELENALGELETANEQLNRVVGVVAHDLRGPLGNILQCQEILSAESTPESAKKEFGNVVKEVAEKALRLVDRLLDRSAIEKGQVELNKETVALEPYLSTVVRLNQPSAEKKGIRLELACEDVSQWTFDPQRVEQVLDNLLGNAFKYCGPDTKVELKVFESWDRLHFEVRDQGPGIHEEDIEKLFDEFQTSRAKPTGDELSTGLGLSICKRIVELHGGAIRVESEWGQGSCFSFYLPK